MIKLCFYQRLAISLVAGFIIILAVFVWLSGLSQNTMQKLAEQTLHLDLATHLAQDNPLLAEGVTDYAALENLFHTQMVLGPSFEFYFISPTGEVLTYSGDMADIHTMQIELAPIQALLGPSPQLPIYGIDPKGIDTNKIFSVAPVNNANGLQGYLYVIIGGVEYDTVWANITSNHAMRSVLIASIAAIVFLLFALLLLFKFFTLPLKELSNDMLKVREYEFDLDQVCIEKKAWVANSHNEVQQLGFSFNAMLDHIEKQMVVLQANDASRKQLLADISHDLRTPLANLQGYIETLSIQHEQLTPAQQKSFIQISLKNLRNLKHLIDQIFELAYLEGGHVRLQHESFSISELLHDVLAKFAIKAEQENVILRIEMPEEHLYVKSDLEKVERVLTNLIDNAIRHTKENGEVCLEAKINKQGSVIIAVCDNGIGIAKSELDAIFTPRYQASNTQTDQQKHVGLGLSICQQLVFKLGSQLQVESELGKGTHFSFVLSNS